MTAVARMAMLDLRTVAPYRNQGLLVLGLGIVAFANRPTVFVLALVMLFTSQFAPYPFNVADKAGLDTLYAVLPLSRRAVLCGHYVWAVALYLATASVGTGLALLLARAQAVPFGGRALSTELTLSWAVFAVNVAIQFPLLIRFGYTRVSVLGTALPLALVVGTVYKLHPTLALVEIWLPVIWLAGVAVIVASVAAATALDRTRYSGPLRPDPTGRVGAS